MAHDNVQEHEHEAPRESHHEAAAAPNPLHNPLFMMTIAELQDEAPTPTAAPAPAVEPPPAPSAAAPPISPPLPPPAPSVSAPTSPASPATTGPSNGPAPRTSAVTPTRPPAPAPTPASAPASSATRPAPAPLPAPVQAPSAADSGPSLAERLLPPAVAGLVAGFLGALFFSLLAGQPEPPNKEDLTRKAVAGKGQGEEPAEPGATRALKTQVDHLTDQVDAFDTRINAKSSTTALEALQIRVDDLAKSGDGPGLSPDTLKGLQNRVGTLEKSLGQVRDNLAALRARIEPAKPQEIPKPPAAPASAEAEPRKPADPDDPAIRQAIDLFKKSKFQEALGAFNKLEVVQPDDARVWYVSALNYGYATNQWAGGAAERARKGVECEVAGTPKAPVIDAALRDLPSTAKEWLATYRSKARPK